MAELRVSFIELSSRGSPLKTIKFENPNPLNFFSKMHCPKGNLQAGASMLQTSSGLGKEMLD